MTSDLPTGNPTPVAPHGRAMRLLVPLALVALLACPRLPELPADGGLVELPGKKQLSWRVALAKGQALRVRATPEEGDLELRLLDPSGRQVARAQGVRDLGETEELAVVAGRTGTYRVELYDLTALSCRLGVDGPRAAGPADRERVDVAQVTQGLYERLHDGAAEKSRRAAIARVEPVLARWRRLGDLGRAAAVRPGSRRTPGRPPRRISSPPRSGPQRRATRCCAPMPSTTPAEPSAKGLATRRRSPSTGRRATSAKRRGSGPSRRSP